MLHCNNNALGAEGGAVFKTLDDVMNFNKANVDAFVQCGSRLAAGVEEMTKEMVGYSGKAFEDVMEGSRAFSSCKSPLGCGTTAAEVNATRLGYHNGSDIQGVGNGSRCCAVESRTDSRVLSQRYESKIVVTLSVRTCLTNRCGWRRLACVFGPSPGIPKSNGLGREVETGNNRGA